MAASLASVFPLTVRAIAGAVRTLLVFSALLGCPADPPATHAGSGDGDGDGSSHEDDTSDEGHGDDTGDGDPGDGDSDGDSMPGNGAELCDGMDNDGNGIVDDRDVEQDGVCDCLAIAYLGGPGMVAAGDVFADWLDKRSDMGAKKLSSITASELAKYQVLVVQNPGLLGTTYSGAELDAIEDWVNEGGGLLTLTGYGGLSEPRDVNVILARFGLSYETPLVLFSAGGTTPISTWKHPHPVTEGITKVGFNNGFPVAGDGVTLASEMGHDVLKAKEVGEGHVLAWGDEWITFNSEWKNHSDYQVERLWQNMIKWLTVADECQVPIVIL